VNGITASVVLYNTPEAQIARLLDCFREASLQLRLYLVDNSPEPAGLTSFHLPWVTYIRSATNRGYGAGHNLALRRILDASEFHFAMNPDIRFGPLELAKMIRFMTENPAVGQLMPRVTDPDGELQYLCKLLPAPADLLLRRFAFGPFANRRRGRHGAFELRSSGYDRIMDVPFLSGCFMLFRTQALRRVGLFDERFFMYAEDIDITRRIHAEYRTVYYPGATIVHDHARDSYKSARALMVHAWNIVRYFNKWGWFHDPQRTCFNREALRLIGPTALVASGACAGSPQGESTQDAVDSSNA